ncbi:MAG: hypothetical protein GQ544_01390 [Candidatus Aminicenantes bacterium]|nr:hypothetical protein [Candidatus Aminicenantes bacterium]
MYEEKQVELNIMDIENEHWKAISKEPTVELVRRIVEDSDRLALSVLLDTRRLFRLKDESPLLLPEFLMKLRDRLAPPVNPALTWDEFADCVYDLTLAKFSNFPDSSSSDDYSLKATGVDCRKCYRAFLQSMQSKTAQKKIERQSQEESLAGRTLQNQVYRNFYWSKLECERDIPPSKRYTWKVNEHKFTLWYPSYITVKKFKAWLEENVRNVNPKAPDEQRRIQSLIDTNLGRGYHVSLDKPGVGSKLSVKEECSSMEFYDGLAFVGSLAETVAQEKVWNIRRLRPAIRKLGREKIERLILQIFTDLTESEYDAGQIARKYGISKATFSRFAGSKWVEKIGDVEVLNIPDLWKNTAEILAGSPVFMETVLTSGFACKLEEILAFIESQEGEKNER